LTTVIQFQTDAAGSETRAAANPPISNVATALTTPRSSHDVGHDRAAEGHDALPSRRDGELRCGRDVLRATRMTSSPANAAASRLAGGPLLFPLRAGAATLLLEKTSAVAAAGDRRTPRHDPVRRADGVSRDARRRALI
jgi:hypothetical protein